MYLLIKKIYYFDKFQMSDDSDSIPNPDPDPDPFPDPDEDPHQNPHQDPDFDPLVPEEPSVEMDVSV